MDTSRSTWSAEEAVGPWSTAEVRARHRRDDTLTPQWSAGEGRDGTPAVTDL